MRPKPRLESLDPQLDARLVERCRAGDCRAWDALVRRHERLVYAVARSYRLPDSDLEDVFQEVFCALVKGLPRLRDARSLCRWLSSTTERIAFAAALRLRRERAFCAQASGWIDELDSDQSPIGADLEELEEQAMVRLAMSALPQGCRQLLTGLFYENPPPSYAELSRRLHLPVGSLGPSRARCLEQLRKLVSRLSAEEICISGEGGTTSTAMRRAILRRRTSLRCGWAPSRPWQSEGHGGTLHHPRGARPRGGIGWMNGNQSHLDGQLAVEFLLNELPAAGRLRVERHLASPCHACRERIRALGLLLDRMRLDRAPEVPARLHAVALEVSRSRASAEPASRRPQLARPVFDSRVDPLPAVARRSLGDARWLRFALGQHTLVLECEPEPDRAVTLRGRLDLRGVDLHRVDVKVGTERLSSWTDAAGVFALEHVPQGRLILTLAGPIGRYRLVLGTTPA